MPKRWNSRLLDCAIAIGKLHERHGANIQSLIIVAIGEGAGRDENLTHFPDPDTSSWASFTTEGEGYFVGR